jgi:hypothetical protein
MAFHRVTRSGEVPPPSSFPAFVARAPYMPGQPVLQRLSCSLLLEAPQLRILTRVR